jgi:hypothetical protein
LVFLFPNIDGGYPVVDRIGLLPLAGLHQAVHLAVDIPQHHKGFIAHSVHDLLLKKTVVRCSLGKGGSDFFKSGDRTRPLILATLSGRHLY